MPRVLGRVEVLQGFLWFVPARRQRGGTRPLALPPGARPENGDYVIAECPWEEPRAQLVEVLGREDDPGWDNQAALSRVRWPSTFRRGAVAEAEAGPVPTLPAPGREDLTDRAAFTMDPVDAADFDDALSWRPLPSGEIEVGVHIADVGHYVPAGSAVDRDARERATSVYLPGTAVPMLPEALSSGLCSLRPGELRYTMSVLVTMNRAGDRLSHRLVRGAIRSRARLSYEEGQRILEGDAGPDPEVAAALRDLAGVADRLTAARFRRGALDIESAELKAKVDGAGRTLRLERYVTFAAHRVVEEFMLLANQVVAEEAVERRSPFLYRVHDEPQRSSLQQLEAQLRALGLPRVEAGATASRTLQRLLEISLPAEKKRLLHQLVLRSLARAEYRAECMPHFGLALDRYAHFTSPIRRYPDLVNHRQVAGWLAGADRERSPKDGDREWAALAMHTTAQEQRAQEAEREAVRVKGLRLMESRLGEEFEGLVVGVVPRGLFVELTDPPVDGFCRVQDAFDDRFEMDDAGVRLEGTRTRRRFALGDMLRVVVVRVDVPAREMELALVVPLASRSPKKRPVVRAPKRQRKGRKRK